MNYIKQNAFKIIISSLILITLGVYWQSSSFGFVWDDEVLYINEVNFPQNDRGANFSQFWTKNDKSMYAPVTYSFWSVLASMGTPKSEKNQKFDPKPFHVFNIVIHIINVLLVFFILMNLVKNHWFAWFGALIFSVHPVQAEAVSWVSEARGLIAAMFGFLAIYYFILHRKKELEQKNISASKPKQQSNKKVKQNAQTKYRNSYIIIAVVSFLLSMLSKPSGVAFAPIIILIELFYFKKSIKQSLIFFGILILIALPVAIITNAGESQFAVKFAAPLWEKPFVFLDTIVFYLINLFFPLNLAACYGRTPAYLSGSPWLYISASIIVVLVVIFYIFRAKDKKFLFAFLIFVAGYLPLSGLVTFNFQYWSTVTDRYLYPSMLGAGLGFAFLLEKFKTEKSAVYFGIAVTIVLAVLASNQVKTWETELSLWDNTIRKFPENSGHPYNARGFIYLEKQKYREALSDFNKSISLNPEEGLTYYNRGNVYFDFKDYNKALADFSSAIRLRPNHADSYINRAMTFEALEKYNEAINDYSKAISLQPNQSDIYVSRGIVFAIIGDNQKAVIDFKSALKINPNYKEAAEYLNRLSGK